MTHSIWLLTTETIPGRHYEILGLLIEQEIIGLNVARDLFAQVKDFFGGRVGSYDAPIRAGMTDCFERLKQRAKEAGGDAVVGLRVSLMPVPFKKMTMLQICAYGTAVRLLDPMESP
ncbi:MAG: heavy metal-binding domain-containing protein [Nitrospirota bacterium]